MREAALLIFCDSQPEACSRLWHLSGTDWQRLLRWLDTSGLALYFLARVTELNQSDMLPSLVFARLQQNLSRYGLSEDALRVQLTWQLTVLKFIDERFRASVLVTDEDVRNYYDQHRANFQKPFESESDSIRKSLEGEQVNQQFEAWLAAARKRAVIQFREEAFE